MVGVGQSGGICDRWDRVGSRGGKEKESILLRCSREQFFVPATSKTYICFIS